jgi:glycosyltransferase involved in cell wall biosynthesis
VFVAATDTSQSPARSGVQTVVRGLIAGLAEIQRDCRLVKWVPERHGLTPLRPNRSATLGSHHQPEGKFLPASSLLVRKYWRTWRKARGRNYRVPLHLHPRHDQALSNAWLLLPEVMYGGEASEVVGYARKHGLRVAAIFHDAIPLSHPHLVRYEAAKGHLEYMRTLGYADLVLAVSNEAAREFRTFVTRHSPKTTRLEVCSEPAEILDAKRITELTSNSRDTVHILCVSTLEPRKNHKLLLQAFEAVCAAHSELDLHLHLIGDSYMGASDIADFVSTCAKKNPRIQWHRRVEPQRLHELYRNSDFTVYPSLIEGFGLPIMESLWFGKPCICANFGVMAENAAGGGCLTLNVNDPRELTEGVVSLATKPDLRRSLAMKAISRKLRTWSEFASDICRALDAETR